MNNVGSPQFGNLHDFLDDAFQDIDLSEPQAYLVYMFFDKQDMNIVAKKSGVIQVAEANALGVLTKSDIIPDRDGFMYVYSTNTSQRPVNFDNLEIRRWKPVVRTTYDYYAYGLTWENPSDSRSEEGLHDCTYQDKEFQFAEFTDGHGLALYDFHVTKLLDEAQRSLRDWNPAAQQCGTRMYDGATGRWLVPDPAAQFSNPYLAMGNNPVVGVDPDGRFVEVVIGAVAGAVINVAIAGLKGDLNGDNWYKYAITGALAGGLGVATGGGAMSLMGGGTFSAGFFGTAAAASASGFTAGAVSSGLGGLVSGILNGAGTGWAQNKSFEESMKMGIQQGIIGGLSAFAIGGLTSGIAASKNGKNFWSGKGKSASQSLNAPTTSSSLDYNLSADMNEGGVIMNDRCRMVNDVIDEVPNDIGAPVLDVVPQDAVLTNRSVVLKSKDNNWTSLKTCQSHGYQMRYRYFWAPRNTPIARLDATLTDSFWAVPEYFNPIWSDGTSSVWKFQWGSGIKIH